MKFSDALFWIGLIAMLGVGGYLYIQAVVRKVFDEFFKRKETHATRVRDMFKEEE